MTRPPRPIRTLAGLLTAPRVLAILAVALVATSATVGTGIGPIDAAVDGAVAVAGSLVDRASGPDGAGSTATPSGPDVQQGVNRTAVERHVHRYVNDERAARGLSPLAWEPPLREIARYHSRDMARTGYVGHVSPDGETVEDRYDRFGYDCRAPTGLFTAATSGENVAKTWFDAPVRTAGGVTRYTTEAELARGIVDGWLNSPAHRENLLADHWRREGIGVVVTVERDRRAVYATQNFC